MLFGSNLLEVAIGVVFVYLLLSLLCSAFSELIESLIRFRARDLERGIGRLLNDPDLVKGFFDHPLIKPLGEKPSYIPARTFSLALWNLATTEAMKAKEIAAGAAAEAAKAKETAAGAITEAAKAKAGAAGVTQDLNAIRDLITSLDKQKYGRIQTSLLTLIDEAGTDINRARRNIEAWYNDAMDRVSGWYKRRTHWILVVMGLLAAAFLNIDTINVTRALWYNDTLRNSVVTAAETYIKNPPAQGEGTAKKDDDPAAQAEAALDKVQYVRGEINKLGLPIGWVYMPDDKKYKDDNGNFVNKAQYDRDLAAYRRDPRRSPDDGYSWFLKVLGILFTALAVSQGAPFWFDLLNKFMVIRSTIKPHEKSQEQPSKDKPAPETNREQTEDTDNI